MRWSCGRRRACGARRRCRATRASRTAPCCWRCSPQGESRITAAGDGEDVRSTARRGGRAGRTRRAGRRARRAASTTVVTSPGGDALVEPDGVLDCGNSGTTTRLVAGLLAGRPLFAVLDGDASLRRRPMGRVVEPLRGDGRDLRGPPRRHAAAPRGQRPRPPGADRLHDAGAQRPGQVRDPARGARRRRRDAGRPRPWPRATTPSGCCVRAASRCEETLDADGAAHRRAVGTRPRPRPLTETVPADPSGAAFWLVAGAIHPDAELRLDGVSTNPTRRAIIDILRRMGAAHRGARPAGPGRTGRRAPRGPRGPVQRAPGHRLSPPPTWRRRSTRSRSCAWPRPPQRGRRGSAGWASSGTRSPIASRGSRTASRHSARTSASRGTTSRSEAAARLAGSGHRDPGRSPAGDDLRRRRSHRRGRDHRAPTRVGRDLVPRLLP